MTSICIVGAGVVGSATGKGLARHGHDVSFVDINPERVKALNAQGFTAADTIHLGDEPTIVFLTLPTPNDGYRWDLGPIVAGVRAVGEALRASRGFHTVVVRSTVPPGTCDGLVRPVLEEMSGSAVGDGFALASNPEFLRARCAAEDFLHPRVTVVGARSPRTVERLAELLQPFGGEQYRYDDPTVSELIKCTHNLFNAAKISFWNELWQVTQALGLEVGTVASVVARSAEASYNPGYGISGGNPYGGACLPKDTKGFLGFAGQLGLDLPLAAAVDKVNERMQELSRSAIRAGRADFMVEFGLREAMEKVTVG
ncbi:MAG TPA: 2-dehydropantoate 2-reductase N-terminal domain-containing protein [Pilimelia sp.]|nr:2-dehydropantoate 2-reductase N-terminal domain-containing protein [Pilimelia sp.]